MTRIACPASRPQRTTYVRIAKHRSLVTRPHGPWTSSTRYRCRVQARSSNVNSANSIGTTQEVRCPDDGRAQRSVVRPARGTRPANRRQLIVDARHRRQGHQDRLDDRRTYPGVAAEHRRTVDHWRATHDRTQDGVRYGRPPAEGAADGQWTGVHFPSAATVVRRQDRNVVHTTGHAVEQRLHRIIQQPPAEGVSEPQPLEHLVRGPRGHRRLQETSTITDTATQCWATDACRVRCGMQAHPHPGSLRDQPNGGQQSDSKIRVDSVSGTRQRGSPRHS